LKSRTSLDERLDSTFTVLSGLRRQRATPSHNGTVHIELFCGDAEGMPDTSFTTDTFSSTSPSSRRPSKFSA
jgi:hypothetical protein